MKKILYSEDPSGGGGAGGDSEHGHSQQNPPAPPSGSPAPPPAAKIVVETTKTERELALEQELEAERAGRKKDQTRVSELENENHQLKQVPQDKPKKKTNAAFKVLGWED